MKKVQFFIKTKAKTVTLLGALLLLLPLAIHAQNTGLKVDNTGTLTVKKGFIYIPGNLEVATKGAVHNEDTMYLGGNIVNQKSQLFITSSILSLANDPLLTDKTIGNVIFTGSARQRIHSQNDSIMFSTLTINNPNEVHLDTSIFAFGAINLAQGSLMLNSHNLSTFIVKPLPLNGGHILAENDQKRIYDTVAINDDMIGKHSGYVKTSSTNTSLNNPNFLGIQLSNYYNLYVDRGHISLPYAGDGSIRKYFKIAKQSGGSINENITISYLDSADYEKLGIKEPDFRVFIKGNPNNPQSNSPVEYMNLGGTLDAAINNATTAVTAAGSIPDTSIWTIADQDCKNPPRIKFATQTLNVCQGVPFTLKDTVTRVSVPGTIYYKWYENGSLTTNKLNTYLDTLTSLDTIKYKVKKYDNRGCFSFDSITVTSRPVPKANIKKLISYYCDGTPIAFADSSSISDASTLTYAWAFGDTQTSAAKTVTHTYPSALKYIGYLATQSLYGCLDTAKFSVDIKPVPVVNFTTQQACYSTKVLFTNQSNIANQEKFRKAVWLFTSKDSLVFDTNDNDTTKITPLKNVFFTYPSATTQMVRLTMTSSGGCQAHLDKSVTINAPIKASFNVSNVCYGTDVALQNTSIPGSGAPTYAWDFGDTTTSSAASPGNKHYAYPGAFDIKLKLTSGTCADSVTHKIYVNPLPDATFAVNNACLGQQISFVPAVPNQGKYSWNINGETFTIQQPVKTFTTAGNFKATLTVRSDSGCTAPYTRNFDVYQVPKADFTAANVCFGNQMTFYNQSVVQGGSLTYNWDFGDDNTSLNTSPTHTYGDSAKTWPVKLVAESNFGCRDSVTKTVETYPLPKAGLPAERSTCGNSMTLDATVTNPKYTVTSYSWSNGVKSPITIVSANNTYSVTLKTSQGCTATESIKVTLNTKVDPMLPDAISFCGKGELDALYPDNNCVWSTGEQQRKITVTQTGWYKVDIKDENNCTARDSSYVTINNVPVLELGSDIAACSGNKVYLNAGAGYTSYQWSTTETTSTIEAKTAGNYKVTITDSNGCSASDAIHVSFLAAPQRVLPKTTTICGKIVLDAGNPGAIYDWSTLATTETLVATQTGVYWVKITNANNCFVYDTASVTILPAAAINLGPDISICDGQFVTLNAGDNGSSYTYAWNGQTSASSTYRADKSGKYIVQALNSMNNCTSSDTIFVSYKTSPVVNLGNDRMLCNSASVTLDAGNAGALIQWGSTTGLVSTRQTIEINGSGRYWATVMNTNGCIGTDTITIYPSAGEMVAEFIAASTVKAGDTVHFVNVSYPEPYSCSWYFGDGVTSAENSPTHVFFMNDTFNVRLSINNDYCSATIKKPIAVQGYKQGFLNHNGSSAGQFVEILSSNLYPNPTSDKITLEITISEPVDMMIAVYDLKGGLLFLEKVKNSSDINKEYSLSHVSPGIYILKASAGKVSKSFKIVKR